VGEVQEDVVMSVVDARKGGVRERAEPGTVQYARRAPVVETWT
jgi:hypothetical protein